LSETDIFLENKNHTYHIKSNIEKKFTSVTELISNHFLPFDTDFLSYIHLHINSNPYSQEGIIEKWKLARDYGSFVHNEIDKFLKYFIEPKTNHGRSGVQWIKSELTKYGKNHFSELIVYSDYYSVAGTIDLVVPSLDGKGCYIFDWKTAEMIDYQTKRWGTTPITKNFNDNRFNKYSLQLSMYRYLLEIEFNIPVINQFIVHLKENSVELIEAEYYPKIIDNMLTENKESE